MGKFNGIDYSAITSLNTSNFKKVVDGGTTSYVQVQDVILIGGGHEPKYQKAVNDAEGSGANHGTITKKGSRQITVTGCDIARGEFESEIAKFSDRKVVYE
jgi:hypothetical protein